MSVKPNDDLSTIVQLISKVVGVAPKALDRPPQKTQASSAKAPHLS